MIKRWSLRFALVAILSVLFAHGIHAIGIHAAFGHLSPTSTPDPYEW